MTDLSTRLLDDLELDEAARPAAPRVPAATDTHRRQGRQLAAIHRHYLMEIAQIGAVLSRIEAGECPPDNLKRIVLSLDMAENFRAFGSLCGRECQILKFHHDIESADMFPRIEAAGGGKFREVGSEAAVETGRWAWSSVFWDLNNDGWEDLLVANGFITTQDTGDL